jgi:FecR protein
MRAIINSPRRRVRYLGLAAMLCVPLTLAAQQAGEVVKLAGIASAATDDGEVRLLADKSPVNAGETVVTSINSFVRMKLTDGGFVVLRPNTRFHIQDYQYAENAANNRSIFSLLKGGFRAVTGFIGKQNHANVSYRTAVATIGIRGTDLEVVDCSDGCTDAGGNPNQGLYFKVHDGGIDVNGQAFADDTAGFMPPGGTPDLIDFNDPNNPLNSDPTPAADPQECF